MDLIRQKYYVQEYFFTITIQMDGFPYSILIIKIIALTLIAPTVVKKEFEISQYKKYIVHLKLFLYFSFSQNTYKKDIH